MDEKQMMRMLKEVTDASIRYSAEQKTEIERLEKELERTNNQVVQLLGQVTRLTNALRGKEE